MAGAANGDSPADASLAPSTDDGAAPPAPDAGANVDLAVPHAALPTVNAHTGSVLSAPEIFTLTFDGNSHRSEIETFGDFVVGSNWLTTVAQEYGVGTATHAGRIHLGAAPTRISDSGIVQKLTAAFAAGTLPAPNGQRLYVVYFSSATKVTAYDGSPLCTGDAEAYHSAGRYAGAQFPYAVVGDCGYGIDGITDDASHEIIEAITDPYDDPKAGYYVDAELPDPWYVQTDEVADLCEDLEAVREGGYALARSWSNAVARAGQDPCVPAPAGDVYFNIALTPATVPSVAPGQSVDIQVTGWALAPHAPWKLALYDADNSDFDAKPVLSAAQIGVGDSITITLSVPATAKSGQLGAVVIYSDDLRFWPVAVQAK